MTQRRTSLALVVVFFGCSAVDPSPPPSSGRARSLDALLESRGFDSSVVDVTEVARGDDTFYHLSVAGVPIDGVAGKRHGDDAPSLPRLRYEGEARPDLVPLVTEDAAYESAAALLPPGARLVSAERVLAPRQELRRKPTARTEGAPLAVDYDRVVVALDLSYRMTIETSKGRHFTALVDARTGAVVRLDPVEVGVTYAPATGHGFYRGTVGMQVELDPGTPNQYVLIDALGNRFVDATVGFPFHGPDAVFGDGLPLDPFPTPANIETVAVDAYDAVHLTWQMFSSVLLRIGPDGHGAPATIAVNWQNDSAEWDGPSRTILVGVRFTTPDPLFGNKLHTMATTDVIAHELGHDFFSSYVYPPGVTPDPSGTEASGLSEGTADVVAFLTELYRDAVAHLPPLSIDELTPTAANYQIAEATSAAIRDMTAPSYPFWTPELVDGTHSRYELLGPIDRAFLLIAYGCKPPPPGGGVQHYTFWSCEGPTSTGIGPIAAAQLWNCMVSHLAPGATFADAYAWAMTCSAEPDFTYGARSRSVASAFHGIHIGPPPDQTAPTATLACHQIADAIECSGEIFDDQTTTPFRNPQLRVDGGPLVVTVDDWLFTTTIGTATLGGGAHTVTLTAWDDWLNQVQVSTTVTLDKTPPLATSSTSGPPKTPTITVTATDPSGVGGIQVYEGAHLLAEDRTAPFAATLATSTWTDGTHTLSVRVFDVFDNAMTLTVPIVVDNTAPAVNMNVGPGLSPFHINATATDASTLTQAVLKRDGAVLLVITGASPYIFVYAPSDGGSHTLSVEVTDAFGNVGVASAPAPKDTTPPNATFSGSQWSTTFTLQANVDDPCGIAMPYQIYVDGQLAAQPTSAGYALVLTTVSPGMHSAELHVADRCGNGEILPLLFALVNTPPDLVIQSRDNSEPKRNVFTLSCADADGVHHTEARHNGVIIASVKGNPAVIPIDTSTWPDGQTSVVFQCMDIYGVPSNAVGATVYVDNTPPSGSIAVYGAGHTYDAVAQNVSDPSEIKSVELLGGLGIPSFDVTDTVTPYDYVWSINSVFIINTQLPFSIVVTDMFGNTMHKTVLCNVNTNTTRPVWLTCVPWR